MLNVPVIRLHTILSTADLYKPIILNEMVISSGNEDNAHFSVTYETESRALTTNKVNLCFGQQVNHIYLRVKRFNKQSKC